MQFSKAWNGKKGVKAHELKHPKPRIEKTTNENKSKAAGGGISYVQKGENK